MFSLPASLPSHHTAVIANSSGALVISRHAPLPTLEPDMIMVKVVAVAINPVDVKLTGAMACNGAVSGCDCAGYVVGIGSSVSSNKFTVGDRAFAAVPGMNSLSPRVGAFAEYVAASPDFTLKIPDAVSFESAAALGVAITSIGYALFYSLKIPGHPEDQTYTTNLPYVLVHGGSTTSGTMAIQLIRKSGLLPITTCSPRNFGLVHDYGAHKAYDYNDPKTAAEIRTYTRNALSYALDCVCEGESMKFCYAALGRAGGRYTSLEPFSERSHTRKVVTPDWVLGPALLGRNVGWKEPYTINADVKLHDFGVTWFSCAQGMLNRGEIRSHPVRVGETIGFEGILEGVEILKRKEVSGEKLVYRIANLD